MVLGNKFDIRRFSSQDSYGELTVFLHRAYAPLLELGLRYVAAWQTEEITKARCEAGECYIALDEDLRLIGTICLKSPEHTRGCEWYDREGVAMFGQFAVDPTCQRNGLGTALIAFAENRAREMGAEELALDTAVPATHLIDYYTRRGYRLVGEAQWETTNYRSVIMSKRL